jgi:hypothetical protein
VGRWLWLCAGFLGGAPADTSIAVVPTAFEGDVSQSDRELLHAAVSDGVERAGLQQVAVPPGDDASEAGARWVLRAVVTSEDRLYEVQLEARDARNGSVVASSTHPCQPCGRDEVRELIVREVAALGGRVARLESTPATLAIESDPPGATVLVDGERVGTTPMEVRLGPGEHRIETQLEGYASQSRTVEAVPGVSERWTPRLHADGSRPDTAVDEGPRRREPLWPAGWALVGTGVASLAVGVTFLALHHRPYRSKCSGADYDANTDLCRYRWTSLPQGAALTAVGGALLVTGAVLAGVGRARRRRTQARIDVHRGGAAVMLEGRF